MTLFVTAYTLSSVQVIDDSRGDVAVVFGVAMVPLIHFSLVHAYMCQGNCMIGIDNKMLTIQLKAFI